MIEYFSDKTDETIFLINQICYVADLIDKKIKLAKCIHNYEHTPIDKSFDDAEVLEILRNILQDLTIAEEKCLEGCIKKE